MSGPQASGSVLVRASGVWDIFRSMGGPLVHASLQAPIRLEPSLADPRLEDYLKSVGYFRAASFDDLAQQFFYRLKDLYAEVQDAYSASGTPVHLDGRLTLATEEHLCLADQRKMRQAADFWMSYYADRKII